MLRTQMRIPLNHPASRPTTKALKLIHTGTVLNVPACPCVRQIAPSKISEKLQTATPAFVASQHRGIKLSTNRYYPYRVFVSAISGATWCAIKRKDYRFLLRPNYLCLSAYGNNELTSLWLLFGVFLCQFLSSDSEYGRRITLQISCGIMWRCYVKYKQIGM